MSYIHYRNRIDQVLSSQGDGTGVNDFAVAGVSITGCTAVATGAGGVLTATGHPYLSGDWIFIDGATGTTELKGLREVVKIDANTFTLLDEAGDPVFTAGTFGGTTDSQYAVLIKPPAGVTYKLSRLNGWGADSAAINESGFLSASALTNGVNVQVYNGDDGAFYDLLAKPITSWMDWALVTGGSDAPAEVATNKTIGGLRWTFNRNTEGGIGNTDVVLNGSDGDFLAVWCQDDLNSIDIIRFSVQGVRS